MIYPTRRAVVFALAGAPVAVLAGLAAPHAWMVGIVWALAALSLVVMDAWLAASPSALELQLQAPDSLGVGRPGEALVSARFAGRAPGRVEVALGGDERLTVGPPRCAFDIRSGVGSAALSLSPHRRGEAMLGELWARWVGPLGLAWVQRRDTPSRAIVITPDIQTVREQALRLFDRDATLGLKAQVETGEGSEFHALKEFQTGMDLRSIDWKSSARLGRLLGREHRTERNHPIVLALDCGRLMCEPVDGRPRIDHVINAALLLAFVGLKLGDRVGLFAFDARPRVVTQPAAGAGVFPLIQRQAARIDYSTEETNFTLGLSTLAGQLNRRGLVVVFTDFADPTSAELMFENVVRLLRTHAVMFVVLRDTELEAIVDRPPGDADDVSRAVIAGSLLHQREIVLARLARAGAQIVEAAPDRLGAELINRYLDARRRELI